jgi:hypothetical protein
MNERIAIRNGVVGSVNLLAARIDAAPEKVIKKTILGFDSSKRLQN